ncbi:MAG: Hsp20/alpha crystallin family protein [Candidatus Brocadiae bacterium]|nr:Hsp20/alpha crystallin family protein [Candidatus Brocadiia bacterium]
MPLWHEQFGEWSTLQREVNRVLDAARQTVDQVVGHFTWPPVNTWETPEEFFVTAEVPGLEVGDFELSVSGPTLLVRATRRPPARPEGAEEIRSERAEGRFERAVVLPGNLETTNINARLERGILIVRIPRTSAARPRKIVVEEGS